MNQLADKEQEVKDAIKMEEQKSLAAEAKEKQSHDKLSDINKQLDHALSEKLELEAKVGSASDELR